MPQNSENFAELVDLDPVLTEIFYQHYNQPMEPLNALITERPTSKDKETDLRIGSFGDPEVFNGTVKYKDAQKGYAPEYTPVEYALGFQVTRRMIDTMQYEGIFDSATQLATSFRRKKAKLLADVFNNYTTTLGYDAKALCANDHPRSKSDTSAVDNLGTTAALGEDSLNDAINQLEALGTDIAEETENGSMANLLIYGRSNRKKAHELIDSELSPEDANTASNFFNSYGLTGIYVPRITGTKWFVADAAFMRSYLKWYTLTPMEFAAQDDFNTLVRQYRGYAAWVVGWSDFRWVVGNAGA